MDVGLGLLFALRNFPRRLHEIEKIRDVGEELRDIFDIVLKIVSYSRDERVSPRPVSRVSCIRDFTCTVADITETVRSKIEESRT